MESASVRAGAMIRAILLVFAGKMRLNFLRTHVQVPDKNYYRKRSALALRWHIPGQTQQEAQTLIRTRDNVVAPQQTSAR